jgi:hypothetical protein
MLIASRADTEEGVSIDAKDTDKSNADKPVKPLGWPDI